MLMCCSIRLILLQLDDWVLCRLYNKKNEWEKMQQQKEMESEASHSHSDTRTPESEIDDDPFPELASLPALDDMVGPAPAAAPAGAILPKEEVEDFGDLGGDDWLAGINLDDLQMPGDADFFGNLLVSPIGRQDGAGRRLPHLL